MVIRTWSFTSHRQAIPLQSDSPAVRLFLPIAALAYVAMIAAIVLMMFSLRESALVNFSTPEARADWEQWRETVAEQQASGESPVERRVPKSPEPNTLVLLRDYFGTCLFAAVFFSSLLYFVFAFFIRGAFFTRPAPSITMEG